MTLELEPKVDRAAPNRNLRATKKEESEDVEVVTDKGPSGHEALTGSQAGSLAFKHTYPEDRHGTPFPEKSSRGQRAREMGCESCLCYQSCDFM